MSRFLSFAIPVKSVEDAVSKIKEYQNRYHDSRHVCWAYMLGRKREIWQLNDNGEPSGTAGKPILGQINSKNLTDILVIVIRYFGGIKLGTSGLIVAYREAAKMAIEDANIIECHEMAFLRLEFPYEYMEGAMRIIKSENLHILDKVFDNICKISIEVRLDDKERLTTLFEKGSVRVEDGS